MVDIVKPTLEDLVQIENILSFWTEKEEVDKYIERIKNEIAGKIEFNMHFWVAKENDNVLGIAGLSNPLPKAMSFAKTIKPAEIKILYVDNNQRGKGIGKELITFIEDEARKNGYQELIVRSAERYKDTAYGFYEKMGYNKVGVLTNEADGKPMQVFEKLL